MFEFNLDFIISKKKIYLMNLSLQGFAIWFTGHSAY